MRSPALGAALLLLAAAVTAQENSTDIINAMKDRAVVLDLTARVVERDVTETWNSETSKVTIPGRPVTLRLVGANVVVAVQFTPYKKEDGKNILVAQGQVWVTTKDEGILYYTSIQTIPIEYGERVFFFPLGQRKDDQRARIEVQLVLTPYVEGEQAKKATTAPKQEAPKTEKTGAAPKSDQAKNDQPKADSPKAEKPPAAPKAEQPKPEKATTAPKTEAPKAEPAKQSLTEPAAAVEGERQAGE